jgi:acyl-CoA thioesterase-1
MRNVMRALKWLIAPVGFAALAVDCGGRENANQSARPGAPSDSAAPVTQSNDALDAAPTSAPRVLIIGTSLTAGYGLDLDDAYPARIQHIADSLRVPARIVGAGLSGETSAGALRRAARLLDRPASIVMIETGANDGLRGLDPDSLAANLRGLIALIRARLPAARIVLVQMEAPRNFGPNYLRMFRHAFESVARESGAVLMPFFLEGVAGVPAMNQEDGIHPNERGAIRAAENAWKTLGPLLRKR